MSRDIVIKNNIFSPLLVLYTGAVFLFPVQVQGQTGTSIETPVSVIPDKTIPLPTEDQELRTLTLDEQKAVITLFSESWRHGLNPEMYETSFFQAEMAKIAAEQHPELNTKIIEAAVRYARDMTGMRIRASDIGLRARDWRQSIDPDVARAAFLSASDPAVYLASLVPQTPLYRALSDELVTLTEKLKNGEGGRAVFPMGKIKRSIRPGDRNKAIIELRNVLGTKPVDGAGPEIYDDVLAQTVIAFQRNHGLKEDGVIGSKTIRFFNQTYFERYRQVVANLERLRWLDPIKPEKYIVVNIPAATLWAVENDTVITEMPVIVGRRKRPTAQFRTLVQGIRFSPTWTVPDVIKKEDFLPELRKDPSFLLTKGVEVWKKDEDSGQQVRIDPLFVDWEDVTEQDLSSFRMVQPAGRSNALGLIRVIMPNQYDIYLHDTNTPEYFRHDDRTVSSGCVRLSRPREIARFVLSREKDWTDERIATEINKGKTRDVMLANQFPVLLLYQTAWLKKGGALVLAYDIYEQDIILYQLLQKNKLLHKITN